MADYSALKATIDASINTNGQQAITGAILNDVLNEMVDVLGEGYQFMGVATPDMNPNTPDQKVFYIAFQPGIYTNFGGVRLKTGYIGILKFDNNWSFSSADIGIEETQSNFQILFNALAESMGYDLEEIPATILNNSYISPSSGVVSTIQSDYWKVLQYEVASGQTYCIKASTQGPYGYFSMYSNGIPVYYKSTSATTPTALEQNIIIPDGVDTLYVAYITNPGGYIQKLTLKPTQRLVSGFEKNILQNSSVLNGYYLDSTGTLVAFSSSLSYKVVVVDLEGGENLEIHASGLVGNAAYTFFDAENNKISFGALTTQLTEEIFNVVAPHNARVVRIASYGRIFLSYELFEVSKLKWSGKKWVVMGDSLTEINNRTTAHYFDFVAGKTGITTINKGISGTGFKNGETTNKAFYQRVSDLPDCDVLTIFGSFNDNVYFSQMGTADDISTDTIGGCINTCLDNLFAAKPLVVVGIVAPTPWQYFYPGVANSDRYVQLLKDICTKRGIPFYDLYHNSNLRPWESAFRELCYSKDDGGGVHPDENGHRIIAPRFEDFLNSLLL